MSFLSTVRGLTAKLLAPVDNRGGWFPWIREPYSGAWQRNDEWTVDSVVAHPTVYSCVTIIANDIGKLRPKLAERDGDGIWSEIESPAFSPVLRRPNRFQNHIQFKQWWIMSKLLRGNTYALKQRDQRGVVVALYILDASRVTPLVAPDGSVFYQLSSDNLAGLEETSITAPASEIIHDRMNCLFHPLVGISPLFAAGTAANIGLEIQSNSSSFFGNGSNPGGVLTAPAAIPQELADRLATIWGEKFGGVNSGKIAVLGDGLTFEPMRMSATDSQLIETLRWSDEKICSVFHVPAYKVGVGQPPAYNNIGALATEYYVTCLQTLIEEYELCLDEGLALPTGYGVELDLDGLIRMDVASQIDTLGKAVAGSLLTIDEARAKLDRKRVKGGDSIWMQQQNYSLEALQKRDAGADPFGTAKPEPAAPPAANDDDGAEKFAAALKTKFLEATANG
jgi:HK97 family phage portal protein